MTDSDDHALLIAEETRPLKIDYVLHYNTLESVSMNEPRMLDNLNPDQCTVNELTDIIREKENEHDLGVQLYTAEGVPLTGDIFFNRWTLRKRRIESGSMLFVIFHSGGSENIRIPTDEKLDHAIGSAVLNVHIMLGGDHEIRAELGIDTIRTLKRKIYDATEIETSCQKLRLESIEDGSIQEEWEIDNTLEENGICDSDSIVVVLASGIYKEYGSKNAKCGADIEPFTQQTETGLAAFYSVLYVVVNYVDEEDADNIVEFVRQLSGCPPLAAALGTYFHHRNMVYPEKVALLEGMYFIFRKILPRRHIGFGMVANTGIIENERVFEYSPACWAYILENSKNYEADVDDFKYVDLVCHLTYERLAEPVKIVGREGQEYTCERRLARKKIEDCELVVGVLFDPSLADALIPDTSLERLLMCLPYSRKSCYIWKIPPKYKPECINIKTESVDVLEARIPEYEFLMVYPPLRLKDTDVLRPCLSMNEKGLLVAYTATCKASGPVQVIIHNPIEMRSENVFPDDLAYRLKDYQFSQTKCSLVKSKDGQFSRNPTEAIVVLFDISGSMDSRCLNGSMTQLDAIKQFFCAFADRSMAYNFKHVIGLTTFNNTVHVMDTCTEAFESFKNEVAYLHSGGGTAMYDAINNALSQLEVISKKYPACKKRILCLTDGCDCSSRTSILTTANALQASDVCLDSVLVGSNNKRLQCLSKISGGCCFFPETEKDGLKLFEMETVLSLSARKDITRKYSVTTQNDIDNYERYTYFEYDKQPAYCVPGDLNERVSSTHTILNKVACDLNQGGLSADKSTGRLKRILREISAYHKQPHPHVHIFPCEINVALWRILLVGPLDTPYEGGVFSLYVEFPENYPLAPPKVRFLTPIYHCNINAAGRICHSIFDRDYTSRTTFSKIMLCVFGLLITPEPDDPLDSITAEEYITNQTTYYRKAKEYTKTHASKSLQHHKQALLGNTPADSEPPPPELVCPLTGEMFVDPVRTPSGKVYERHALESHLSLRKEDPLTREHLRRDQLKEKNDIKKLVFEFRSSRIKAAAWWQDK
ncbi:uncharacterized protein LOC102801018 [Saccoglossus kowalevskii]|uniref:Uncharacterized protein LOC102801018 n=1 Tax=Saccoglossus kowalevskii TaxID=10224 RepID=A0ABM0MSB0_SACKO|nr:PREDICTED: uncharacterized protein LOC102801018 [Saccoglossus kowalevskii]